MFGVVLFPLSVILYNLHIRDELQGQVAKVAHKAIHHACELFWSVLEEHVDQSECSLG